MFTKNIVSSCLTLEERRLIKHSRITELWAFCIYFPCFNSFQFKTARTWSLLLSRPKVAIPLRSPSSRHWNINSDLIFGLAVDTHCRWHEAKLTGQDLQQEFVGAEESPRQAPIPREFPPAIAGSSQAVSPTETACQEK